MGKLPDFLIIGEMKCGTTALYNYITKHPQVKPAKKKEIGFFNSYYEQGLDWYQDHFPDYPKCVTGEASGYLKFPDAIERIYRTVPQVKLIVILRNPVDRAYSHYHMHLRKKKISIPFEKAIQSTPGYLNQGKYAWKLWKWMEYFPQKQFHIMQTEALYNAPRKTMNTVFKFLELPSCPLNGYKHHNTGSYKEMNPATRKKLIDYYKPYNKELYPFLETNYNWNQ